MVELDIAPLAYDQLATSDWLPNMQPYQYQWEAFRWMHEALDTQRTLCLFLVTPTGSGKTLATYAHSILTGEPIIGAYPTNELIRDQERALSEALQTTNSNRVIRVDSNELDRWQIELDTARHGATLEALLRYEPILLTNPDILFYVAFGLYPNLASLSRRLWALMGNYRLFAFDEFHLYNIKQQADVAFIVGAVHAINPNKGRVFVFASATPDLEMVSLLREQLGLWVEVLYAQPSAAPTARTMAHPLHLSLVPANLDRWQTLAALEENWSVVETLQAQYPTARWVTILDSVAGAIMTARSLRERFGAERVGEVHGLSSEAARAEALAKPFTVGTSTIEVGVDFKDVFEKDFLLFEARTSSQFLQRLGRLARHAKRLPIPNHAIAFVPEYVCAFVAEQLGIETTITRERLRTLIDDAYHPPEAFRRFLRKHAAVEMAEAAKVALGMFHLDDRPRIEAEFQRVIERLTGRTLNQAHGQRRQYREQEILAPLLTFRGAGLEAALLDERGEDIGFPAKRYDLSFLLRRGAQQEMSAESFTIELERLRSSNAYWINEVTRELRFAKAIESAPDKLLGVFGFFRLSALLDDARKVWFEIDQEQVLGKKATVTVVEGLQISTDPHTPLRLLNRALERKRIVAWIMDSPPSNIKFGRALPPLFEVYELRVNRPSGQAIAGAWSIAFNQNAFFIDSLWWNRRDDDAIIT